MKAFIYDPIKNVPSNEFSIGFGILWQFICSEIYYSCHRSTEEKFTFWIGISLARRLQARRQTQKNVHGHVKSNIQASQFSGMHQYHVYMLIFGNISGSALRAYQCAFVFFPMNVIFTMELYIMDLKLALNSFSTPTSCFNCFELHNTQSG